MQHRLIYIGGLLLAATGLVAAPAFATTIVVNASTWSLVASPTVNGGGACTTSGSPCPTWVLPEPASDTTPEPVGDFILSQPIGGFPNGYWTIPEVTGGNSDIITFTNAAPGGNGEIKFYSDPPVGGFPSLAGLTQANDSPLCAGGEPATGCVASILGLLMNDGSVLHFTVASDGDTGTFDPFGSGMNTSDGIQFTDAQLGRVAAVPEPASMLLLGTGLIGVGARRWRNRRKGA